MAIVGDRLYTDILTGHNAGITSILVLTGESSREAAALATNKPDYIFSDLAAIAKAMQT
jgi:4-nitrophenyl phosphatase